MQRPCSSLPWSGHKPMRALRFVRQPKRCRRTWCHPTPRWSSLVAPSLLLCAETSETHCSAGKSWWLHLQEVPTGSDKAWKVLSAHRFQTFLLLVVHPSLVNRVPLPRWLSLCGIFNLLQVNTLCTHVSHSLIMYCIPSTTKSTGGMRRNSPFR